MVSESVLARTSIDAVALKPTAVDVSRAASLPVDAIGDYAARREPVLVRGSLDALGR
ncbi:hypothetical protein [Halorientalis sp. IM1011]|uniref:hypothetical protein n=1 Tax=Halorientalis sp. IM1011 TaxID=1932360 RepID=UPI0012F9CE2A|nr:hypothetical protein [Halorientalis sp. IM1011]